MWTQDPYVNRQTRFKRFRNERLLCQHYARVLWCAENARRIFRARSHRSPRVLRRGENISRAQSMVGTRTAAQGEHSARAANDSRADCSTRTFRARGQRFARVLRRGENTPRARPTIRTRITVQGEHSARGARAAVGFGANQQISPG